MKVVLREDESGVSEVVGTILILAITVVLFSTIIVWVSSIPTPVAQTRVDIQGNLNPVFNGVGTEVRDWINMTHQGGESLNAVSTVIYIQDQKGTAAPTTDVIRLGPFGNHGTIQYGLLDGSGSSWSVGQRFAYSNNTIRSSDTVTVTIVDASRGTVIWSSRLTPPAGTRPPVFLNVYAAQNNAGTPLPVQTGSHFYIFAQVMAPDNNLNPSSVFGTITYYFGSASCAMPIQMFDDGRTSVDGDAVANDGIFTLYTNACTGNAVSGMDGTLVLFNATDLKGHQATTRMVLHVVPGSAGGIGGGGLGGSGRPPNLRWNGNQGYNIFNATQWDTYGYSANPTRNFKGADTVVVVVGSSSLQNVFGMDQFNVWDPYSGSPSQAVVYGATKTVGPGSLPSTTSAFSFFQFVNGYYIYSFRFKLNDPNSVGTNFYTTPPQYPRYYYFASYPLSVLLTDSKGDRFTTTDSVNITADNGQLRTFPMVQTFADPGFSQPSSTFRSTAVVYVQVRMLTVEINTSMSSVFFGNVIIQDYAGGQELNRAPTNGIYSNLPICPPFPNGVPCGTANQAIWSHSGTVAYRFAINLARVNQDPWVAGTQNYALILTSIKDSDESYSSSSTQIAVQAPLYKMDMIVGNSPATNNAWGTKDYMYFFQDYNGFDIWKPLRVDYCSGLNTISGIPGQGQGKCPGTAGVSVAFGDFWHDGTLGAAESIISSTPTSNSVVIYRRALDATGAVVYLPTFFDFPTNPTCTAIAVGDVTGNGLPSVICGGSNGKVWYYANNGNWSQVVVDTPATGQMINSVAVGDFNGDGWNDIAVAGANGYMKWYPNLRFGRFQNTGINDNWFASSEQIVKGNITQGSYLTTYVRDGAYEQLQEAALNIPIQTGATTNPGMNIFAQNWTFASAYNGASGQTPSTGGNPNAYAQITTPSRSSGVVAGYWYQPFTVSGSAPFSATLNLSYEVTAFGATGGSITMYAFVDTTSGAPPQNPTSSNYVWTSGQILGTRAWTSANGLNVGNKVTVGGTYYLKVAMYTTYVSGGSNSVGGFDNVALSWSSTPGSTSVLEHYYRMPPLPTRAGTTFTFNLYGYETGGNTAPDYDNFTIAYSTNVVGTDPTTGTYTTMFTVNSGTPANYAFGLPGTVAGQVVWIRVLDTNRVIGASRLDSLFVDQMYINANTPAGTTGVTLTNPGDATTINMIDAQDSNLDGFSDLVVGTTGGRVFVYLGSAGGLQTPTSSWYSTGGTSIVGVKWGNFSTNFLGLEIGLAFGTTVRVIRGDVANTVIQNSLPAFTPSSTITAFAVGDINGDGWDDIMIGTVNGDIFLWENLGQATAWTYTVTVGSLGAQIYSLALGDSTNSQYQGR